MENREKTVNLLESFLSDKQVDGVCGYIVDPDGEGPIQVIVVLDIDYIQEANTKPGFIARMIKQGVKQEIEKWLGFDVYVGYVKRAPNWWIKNYLEWAYRIIKQPIRGRRQIHLVRFLINLLLKRY